MLRHWIPISAILVVLALAWPGGASQTRAQTYPPPVGSLTVTSSTTVPQPGASVEVTATVRDSQGNPIADQDVTFTITSQPGTDASLPSLSKTVKSDQNGVARVTLFAGSTAGNIIIKIVAGEKTSQLTLQVGGAALPPTGALPVEDDGGLAGWTIALIAIAIVLTLAGALVIWARLSGRQARRRA